ncbi:MAG: zinc-binding alcohol dehydrogenase family protein [Proteiniphilum sp.]|jgi:NADPH:quinone reductase-like Zn-dependent oxidoreductase
MLAALLDQLDSLPVFGDCPEPIPKENQIIMEVKAVALKNLDKLKTRSAYYAPYRVVPTAVGTDGVGTLPDGREVYALGITGTLAQKAVIPADRYTVLPKGLDHALAAALPNAVLGSAIPLVARAGMKRGDVILINGATGITGKVAVQVAKHYGASRVIAVGRNEGALRCLESSGTVVPISLRREATDIVKQIKEIDRKTPVDIVIDYLWGKPAELLIQAIQESGPRARQLKFVTVGDMAGKSIPLSSGGLRSSDIVLSGSGFGSLYPEVLSLFSNQILPEMFQLAINGQLTLETENFRLEEIEAAWQAKPNGKRVVVLIPDLADECTPR